MGRSGDREVCVIMRLCVVWCVLLYMGFSLWTLNGPSWSITTAVVGYRAQKAFSFCIQTAMLRRNTSLFLTLFTTIILKSRFISSVLAQ